VNQSLRFRALKDGIRLVAGDLPGVFLLYEEPGRSVEEEARLRRLVTAFEGHPAGALAETDEVHTVDELLDLLVGMDLEGRGDGFFDGNDACHGGGASGKRFAEAVPMVILP